jgi:hypothetical protein
LRNSTLIEQAGRRLRDSLVSIGAGAANAVRFSHHDENCSLFKGKLLRRIREESSALIFDGAWNNILTLGMRKDRAGLLSVGPVQSE